MLYFDAGMVSVSMTSGSLGHNIAIGSEAVGLLFMSEQALLICHEFLLGRWNKTGQMLSLR